VKPEVPEDDVPRLPRGRGLRLSGPDLMKIAMLAAGLVALIVLQRPCSDSVAKLVTSFDGSGSGSAAMPKPGTVDRPDSGPDGSNAGSGSGFVHLTPDMTPEQVRQAIDKARGSSN
jgi:hypothetical protein